MPMELLHGPKPEIRGLLKILWAVLHGGSAAISLVQDKALHK